MIDEIRTLLTRNLPGYEVRSVTGVAEGLDNTAHEVNGELIVRTSREADPARRAASTRREAELLIAVAETSTLPVPEPVFADPEAGAIAYRKLPGLPLMDHSVADPRLLAADLGRFLGCLHGTPLGKIEGLAERDPYPMAAWLEDAEEDYRNFSKCLPAEARRQIEGFLRHPPPTGTQRLALCHNDLGAEHVLVDVEANTVTGIIDWTDATITDPARDLALVYRDLGSEVFNQALVHYDGFFDDADRGRAVFYARCKLIEDLAHGFGSPGAGRYAEAGMSHLTQTFA